MCHASAADFDSSFEKVCEKVKLVVNKYKLNPVWIKADIVDFVQRMYYPEIKDAFLSM